MDFIIDLFNSSGFITIITMGFAFLGLSVRYCFQSKCTHCNLCFGLIDIVRDGKLENEEQQYEIDHIPISRRNSVV